MASGDLVPKQGTALARNTSEMVSRGLQLVDPSAQREVFISETECINLLEKYREMRYRTGVERSDTLFFRCGRTHIHHLDGPDLNEFLQAFDRVKLNEGYVLDYVYDLRAICPGPLVYAREVDSEPISSPGEYREAFGLPQNILPGEEPTRADSLPYLRHMRFDRNATGYFQFALFCRTLPRCDRREDWSLDREFIFTDSDLKLRLLFAHGKAGGNKGISGADRLRMNTLNLKPRVGFRGDSAEVTMFCWERYPGYSYLHTYVHWPNGFEKTEDEIVVRSQYERQSW